MTLIITLFASYRSEQQLLEARTLETNSREAQRIAESVDLLFDSIDRSLRTFAGEFIHDQKLKSSAEASRTLRLLYESTDYYAEVFVANPDGKVVAAYSGEPSDSRINNIEASLLKQAMRVRGSFQSLPYRDAQSGMAILSTDAIYAEDGTYQGVVGGILHMESDIIRDGLFGNRTIDEQNSFAYIVNEQATLIYHTDPARQSEDINSNQVISDLSQGRSGKQKWTSETDQRYLVAYTYSHTTNWGILVQTPNRWISEQQNEQLRRTLFVVLVPFFILVITTLWLADRIAAPFVSLTNFVARAAERPQDAAIPTVRRHWNREVDLLSGAVMRTVQEMKRQNRDLSDFAWKDSLTGLLNRRAIDETLQKLEGDNRHFALLLIDIDYFKSVNDRYGHAAGDTVLREVAHILEHTISSRDLCGRYGGEEFVVILPDLSLQETYQVAERLRVAVAAHENELGIPVTLSIGGAVSPMQSTQVDELLKLADRALYRAKERGRNTVVL
nr:sensor domain-containing diguanylate cyclase [Saccharibacillus sp. JS10]